MTRNVIKFAAAISATILPLVAMTPAASAAKRHTPSLARHYPDVRAQWAPSRAAPNFDPYGVDENEAVYLNGWSSSNDPGDCNRGCVNSNGS